MSQLLRFFTPSSTSTLRLKAFPISNRLHRRCVGTKKWGRKLSFRPHSNFKNVVVGETHQTCVALVCGLAPYLACLVVDAGADYGAADGIFGQRPRFVKLFPLPKKGLTVLDGSEVAMTARNDCILFYIKNQTPIFSLTYFVFCLFFL